MASCHYHYDGFGLTRRIVATVEYPVDEPPERVTIGTEQYQRRKFCSCRMVNGRFGCSSCDHTFKKSLRVGTFCPRCGAEVIS